MVTYAATLDVPRHIVVHLSRLLAARRRRLGTPRGSRALGTFRQAVLVRRWFRERGCVHCLTKDAGISQATIIATCTRASTSSRPKHPICTRCWTAAARRRESRDPRRHAHRERPPGRHPGQRQRPVVQPETQELRRQRPVPVRPGRHPAVGLRCRGGLHPGHHRRPAARPARVVARQPQTACPPWPTRDTSAPASDTRVPVRRPKGKSDRRLLRWHAGLCLVSTQTERSRPYHRVEHKRNPKPETGTRVCGEPVSHFW